MANKKSDKSASAKRPVVVPTRPTDKQAAPLKEKVEEARPVRFEDLTFKERQFPFSQYLNRMKISYHNLNYTTEKEEQCKRQMIVRQHYETCEEDGTSIRNATYSLMKSKLVEFIEQLKARNDEESSEIIDNSISDNPEIEYTVEKINSKQRWNNILRYECKWQNYSSDENTFETMQYLDNSLILVKHFENLSYKKAQNKSKIKVKEIEDKAQEPVDAVWKSLKHLKFPEEILAYDTWTGTCWVSFKNIGETAKIHCSVIKEKFPVLWIKFFKEHRQDFKRGKIKPIFLLTKQPNLVRGRGVHESEPHSSTSRG